MPLMMALETENVECVKVLLDKGAEVNMQDKVSGVIIHCVHAMRVISCQVKQHMHLMFQIWLNFSIYIGLHMSSHFPILYVHNLNGCRITQH